MRQIGTRGLKPLDMEEKNATNQDAQWGERLKVTKVDVTVITHYAPSFLFKTIAPITCLPEKPEKPTCFSESHYSSYGHFVGGNVI